MGFCKVLEYRSLISVELQATSQSRRSPTNVSTGAVTATLLARKFVDYIGNGLLLCPWGRAVPHDQGTCQVWSAVYSQVNDGIVVGWGDSSLDDVLQSITFLTIPFMEGILMVDGDLLFVGGGQLSWFCVLVQKSGIYIPTLYRNPQHEAPLEKLIQQTEIVHKETVFRKLQIAEAVSITCQHPTINIQQSADFILPSARPQQTIHHQEQQAPRQQPPQEQQPQEQQVQPANQRPGPVTRAAANLARTSRQPPDSHPQPNSQ